MKKVLVIGSNVKAKKIVEELKIEVDYFINLCIPREYYSETLDAFIEEGDIVMILPKFFSYLPTDREFVKIIM